jgi:hypothetical protein
LATWVLILFFVPEEDSMAGSVKITSDLRLIVAPDAPPLSGSQALDLGKRLIEKGAAAIAREAVGWPQRYRVRREVDDAA